jgi:hypothetical protein
MHPTTGFHFHMLGQAKASLDMIQAMAWYATRDQAKCR